MSSMEKIGCYSFIRPTRKTSKGTIWLVVCECGVTKEVYKHTIVCGKPKNCKNCRYQPLTYSVIKHEKHAELIFRCGRISLVDTEDLSILEKYPRCTVADKYIHVKHGNYKIPLHRLIMGVPEYDGVNVVDHINGDEMDNRKSNLRITTHLQNGINKKSNNVSYSKRSVTCPWRAYVTINRKQIHLGYYSSKKDAETAIKGYFKLFKYFEGQKTLTNNS